jgi:hypothetical protein
MKEWLIFATEHAIVIIDALALIIIFVKKFLSTISEYPFQEGSSLNAAGINYNTLKAAAALKRLHELETIALPGSCNTRDRRARTAARSSICCGA